MKDYITRIIKHKRNQKYSYVYFDKNNNKVDPKIVKMCLQGLYIPPAHNNVKINLNKNDKILAIGYDTKNRPQYVYNKKFTKKQSEKKYDHMIEFGKSYHKIIKQINKDMYNENDSKNKQIASALKLIIECNFRIGNDKYLKENKSHGVTTLLNEHIKINGDTVILDFIGKKGVQNTCRVKNKKLSKNLKMKKRTLHKKDRIFTYRYKNKYYNLKSTDVNKYLKQFGDFSAKNFRTWIANLEFITLLLKQDMIESLNERKKIINQSLEAIANKLHNTKSVCKSNYIDPYLVETYLNDHQRFMSTFKNSFSKDEISKKYIELLNHKL
jgi:DNA topoisomerase-1